MDNPQKPLTVYEDDTYLVSYPKSGNTWMRFLIGTLAFESKIDWLNLDRFPDCYRPEETLLSAPSPRLIKSHEPYDDRYPKVIYVVRDVRDVCVSYYYHHLRHGARPDLPFGHFFEAFISGAVWPGEWGQHVSGWIERQAKIQNGFLLLRYEDLKRDAFKEAARIVAFLNLRRTDAEIKEAIEWSSFDNMRKLEQEQWTNPQSDIPFVRQGRINSWRSFLTDEQQSAITARYGEILGSLGY